MTEKPKPKRRGIPSTHFTPEKGNAICDRISLGESLRSICRDKDQPAKIVVLRWLRDIPTFRTQYEIARDDQADTYFDEIIDIADDAKNDWIERKHFAGDDESPQVNGEAIARARLRIDTRKWMAGKLRPKKYGEKLEVDQKTTLDVTDPLMAVLTDVAKRGKRLADE